MTPYKPAQFCTSKSADFLSSVWTFIKATPLLYITTNNVQYSNNYKPWSRYISKGNVVVSDIPQAGEDLCEGSHDQVLAVSATTQSQE